MRTTGRGRAILFVVGVMWPTLMWSVRPAAAGESPGWVAPVVAPVIDPFRPPASRYGPGNRGLEYGTTGGETVVAVADGRVTFAGSIGGRRFIVVLHPDGLRSTYASMSSMDVVRGQRVTQGRPIGQAGPGFHLTARLGEDYLDPALLFDGFEVVLSLVEGAERHPGPPGMPLPIRLGRRVLDPVLASGDAVLDLSVTPQIVAFAEATETWYRQDCTPADVVVGPAGAGRVLIQVAGLGSSDGDGAIGGLDPVALGYGPDDVVGFSYDGGCTTSPFGLDRPGSLTREVGPNPYRPADTHQDIDRSAAHLADLVERVAASRPGQPIDIAAHSLGGIVTRRALEILTDRHHGQLPVNVVLTIGSPHQGADLATTAVAVQGHPLDGAVDVVLPGNTPGSGGQESTIRHADSVSQVAEVGVNRLGPPGPPPDGVKVVAVAGATDVVVPADKAIWDGAENVIVTTPILDAFGVHGGLPSDPAVARELSLAVSGLPPSCVGLGRLLRSVAGARAVSSGEDLLTVALGVVRFLG